jgi:hypothetical protein
MTVGGSVLLGLLLYSTNTLLKFRIQEDYRHEHYVWCSPAFEAAKLSRYALGATTPPSSDPVSIYRPGVTEEPELLRKYYKEAEDVLSEIRARLRIRPGDEFVEIESCDRQLFDKRFKRYYRPREDF